MAELRCYAAFCDHICREYICAVIQILGITERNTIFEWNHIRYLIFVKNRDLYQTSSLPKVEVLLPKIQKKKRNTRE